MATVTVVVVVLIFMIVNIATATIITTIIVFLILVMKHDSATEWVDAELGLGGSDSKAKILPHAQKTCSYDVQHLDTLGTCHLAAPYPWRVAM